MAIRTLAEVEFLRQSAGLLVEADEMEGFVINATGNGTFLSSQINVGSEQEALKGISVYAPGGTVEDKFSLVIYNANNSEAARPIKNMPIFFVGSLLPLTFDPGKQLELGQYLKGELVVASGTAQKFVMLLERVK